MAASPEFSVVIPTHNRLEVLAEVIRALEFQDGAPEFEVVVVDDGSSDGTAAHLATLVARGTIRFLRTIRTPHVGLAAARNAGVRASRGTHVYFIDDDVVPAPGCIAAMLRHTGFAPNDVHVGELRNVRLAAVRSLLAASRAVDFKGFSPLDELCEFHSMYAAAKVLFSGETSSPPAVWWAVITGGNLCVPRTALSAVGGFDESFTHWGPEDADLCYRLFRSGITARYHDDCRLFHLDHPRDAKLIRVAMMRNAGLLYKKHGTPHELLEYLRFFNGMSTLEHFNNVTAAAYGLARLRLADFRITMKDATQQERVLAWRTA